MHKCIYHPIHIISVSIHIKEVKKKEGKGGGKGGGKGEGEEKVNKKTMVGKEKKDK